MWFYLLRGFYRVGLNYRSQVARMLQASSGRSDKQQQEKIQETWERNFSPHLYRAGGENVKFWRILLFNRAREQKAPFFNVNMRTFAGDFRCIR